MARRRTLEQVAQALQDALDRANLKPTTVRVDANRAGRIVVIMTELDLSEPIRQKLSQHPCVERAEVSLEFPWIVHAYTHSDTDDLAVLSAEDLAGSD